MTAEQILRTRGGTALFGADHKKGFESLVKIWHPDRNKDPKAVDVFKHILAVRDGKLPALEEIAIPRGKIRVNDDTIEFLSVADGERILAAVNSTSNPNFRKRVPCSVSHTADAVTFQRPVDTIMLPTLMKGYPSGLPTFHVAWIASRLYEHVMMQAATLRLLHGGLYTDAILVSITDHGITPLDWRFNAPLGAKMRALPELILATIALNEGMSEKDTMAGFSSSSTALVKGSGVLALSKAPENAAVVTY